MTDPDKNSDELYDRLYTYWDEIPFLINVDPNNLFKVLQSKVRSFILKYMRDGIIEMSDKTKEKCRRHAFTIKELYEVYSERNDKNGYTIQNFHFHINKLKEEGFVQQIAKILEGRHYRIYYGRTAIVYESIYSDHVTQFHRTQTYDPMKELIQVMNPEIDEDKIDHLVEENLSLIQDFYYRVYSWMEDNYESFYQSGFDLKKLLQISAHYAHHHTKLMENTGEIASLLGLDKIMDYPPYKLDNKKE